MAKLGVKVRKADYTRPQTLQSAFAGAEKVLLISSSEVGQRVSQHANVIEAAQKAGVGLLAYTSILHADSTPLHLGQEHQRTEEMIKASGLPYVLLRNGWYTENYTAGIPMVLESGILAGCAGQGRISSASRADYAAAAAKVLLADTPAGNIYELAGDTAFTLDEYAAEISRLAGKPVRYQNMPEQAYAALLKEAGLPDGLADMLADSETGLSKGGLFDDSQTLSRIIGRPTTPMPISVEKAVVKADGV